MFPKYGIKNSTPYLYFSAGMMNFTGQDGPQVIVTLKNAMKRKFIYI